MIVRRYFEYPSNEEKMNNINIKEIKESNNESNEFI